jgi:hypothetical protein
VGHLCRESVDWIYLAQDRVSQRATASTAMNLFVPYKAWKFFIICATVIFPIRVLMRGVVITTAPYSWRRGQVLNILASFSGCSGFSFLSKDLLSWGFWRFAQSFQAYIGTDFVIMTASLHILSNSLFINHLVIRWNIIWAADIWDMLGDHPNILTPVLALLRVSDVFWLLWLFTWVFYRTID